MKTVPIPIAKIFILLILNGIVTSSGGQSFAELIVRMNLLPANQRQAVADSFLNSGISLPHVENDTLAHYIYTGTAQSVAMAGDATGWNPNRPLNNVNGTTFWYLTQSYEKDARLDYKFVVNGNTWILDPENPNTCTGGYGPNSELQMPDYQVPPEISFYAGIPHGTVRDTVFHSNVLGNSRQVKIYTPPGYPTGRDSYPLILFHDGTDYLSLGNTVNILDYLMSEYLITPVIAIFVPPVDRTPEYSGSKTDQFTEFITAELMPVIDAAYKTSRNPAQRAMAGASNGGNIALYIGMKHPEQFGKIAAQSSNVISAVSQTFSNGPKLNLELYLDIGTYDIPVLIPMVHSLRDILQDRNYTFEFREWHEGHSWGNWKGHLWTPLMQFFPYSNGYQTIHKLTGHGFAGLGPNPFFGKTMFTIETEANTYIDIFLIDLRGNVLETVFSGQVPQKSNVMRYEHHHPPGQYILLMKENRVVVDSILFQAL